ncbi:MAG: DNA repair protein RecO [Candidatus Sumerlaeota bacterium]
MQQTETPALVLQTRPWRETSLIVELLTRSRGRIGAIVRGAKRKGRSESANLQPGALINARLSIRPQVSLATLTGVDPVQPPPAVRARRAGLSDPAGLLARSAWAGLYGEILHQSRENDPHAETLFDTARQFFQELGETPHPGSAALSGLFLLLQAFGFGLDLSDTRSGVEDNIEIDLLAGTYLTTHESPGHGRRAAFVLSPKAFNALIHLLQKGVKEETPFVPRSAGPEIARLLVALFEAQLETRLRSARYLEEMVLRPMET